MGDPQAPCLPPPEATASRPPPSDHRLATTGPPALPLQHGVPALLPPLNNPTMAAVFMYQPMVVA
ncbi:hypothetical protein HYPSUDRAFT_209357 [Hypholoma sublateritium FD-334 SS-4]|uniref:Uncharacterized protein n=1 Tax=Hypholoma sublateritium (strain FD-334 SS-4) TaxID=945553 RepID=A0A0D2NAN6_HYPSF|nr:hypothetical protein HYPSUDRAFT_209357 [Hypholoma sublateritium FD-334 SS-4]